jgi:hypothetical protein
MTHIIALTAYTNDATETECKKIGIKKVMNKPINYKILHSIMWLHYYRVTEIEY